jgi:acyl-CoA thioesterase YciA
MGDERPWGALALQTIAMPADTNASGDIFGGWLMAQMDLAATVPARARARGRVATVAVESIRFQRPVRVGDLVSIHAGIVREGRTSMVIELETWVTRPAGERLRVCDARFVFFALDDEGRKRPLPEQSA